MPLNPGSRLGPYEVVSALGAGGMGEVYRARDTRLQRDVAIKILPEGFASDPERLARFHREAQVLASLNHPHIAQIYGLEDRALVMELVEGETLADRIARGPIPPDHAVPVARQIAEALEAAHERGIIHRDLKPANIKVTPGGAVKVLDFGLAKAYASDSSSGLAAIDVSHSPTFVQTRTQPGLILGTAAYMSPEQVRGQRLDTRTDIWAFGAVLFEMLAGRPLFVGSTVTDLLASVLREEPDWGGLPSATPPRLRALLRRCLERDPRRRLRDIGEARIALEDVSTGSDESAASAVPASPPGRARERALWAAAVTAAVLIGVAAGRFVLSSRTQQSRPVRFEIDAGTVSSAALSPDGSRLAIASQGPLLLRDLARLDTRPLEHTDGAVRPFWSRDGQTIAYGARGKLWKVSVDGGTPVAICDLAGGLWDNDAGGVWLDDGTIVYSDGNTGLFQVSAQGGDPVEILKPDGKRELHYHTAIGLPDGRSVVFAVHRPEGVDTLALWSQGTSRVLLQMPGQTLDDPAYSPTGHLLFLREPANPGIWAVPFSVRSGTIGGEPFLVAAGMRNPSVSADGTLVDLPIRKPRQVNLAWAGRDGTIVSHIDEARLRQTDAAISPDGDRIAIPETTDGKLDIWLYDLRRNTRTRLTGDGNANNPAWTPDGQSVVYNSVTARGQGVVMKRVAADGSGRTTELGEGRLPVVSRDGGSLFYVGTDNAGLRLWYRPLANRDAKPAAFVNQAFYDVFPAPSPDGRFIAYQAAPAPGQGEIYLRRFPPTDEVWQVSTGGGVWPHWTRDGHLYFAKGADIFEVDVTTMPQVRLGAPVRLFTRMPTGSAAVPSAFDVTPDGKRFLVYEPVGTAAEDRITVVLNWFAEFAK